MDTVFKRLNRSLVSFRQYSLSIIRYVNRAGDAHSIHSPFVFALYQQIIKADKADEPVFDQIESRRKALLQSTQQINVTDFGAGLRSVGLRSVGLRSVGPFVTGETATSRSVADIARRSLKPARYGRLLHRLVRRFATGGTVLELGTSLGLTTAYLATGTTDHARPARLITFEGCPETANIARQQVDALGLTNIEIVTGNLDETLIHTLAKLDSVDLVFFDANHRFEPTVRYFREMVAKAHNDSVFVLDDIHWSVEMEQAWSQIQAHPAVTISIDLFGVGLLFFRREQPKQHFILQF